MLCLKRQEGEAVLVGSDVVVRVLRTADGEVELGFEAPRSIRIVREELNARERTTGWGQK